MAENTGDIAGIALAGSALHEIADIDVIVARRLRSSSIAQRYVAVPTGVVEEREITDGHIAETSCIAAERFVPNASLLCMMEFASALKPTAVLNPAAWVAPSA